MPFKNNGNPKGEAIPKGLQMEGCAIYVLVDALGWELIGNRSFLDDIVVERCRLQTVLGYSSAAIPSILTGRYPIEHGHWNLLYLSPETSPFRWTRFLRPLPQAMLETRVGRKLVKEVSRRLGGYSGYFSTYAVPVRRLPFFDVCERQDIYQPGALGRCPSIFDVLAEQGIRYECFTYHGYTDSEIVARVAERLRTAPTQVYFLYLSELDSYLHFHIGDAAGVPTRIKAYEEGLRRVYRVAAQRWGEVRLFIFSDHGMTPIHSTYDLVPEVERLGLSVPDDFLPTYDSTMARFWIWTDRARERLTNLLATQPCGRIVSEQELRRLGVWFEDGRYGHLIFLMQSGVTITPSDMARIRFAGMHGFHPDEPTSDGILFSSVPLAEKPDHITGLNRLILGDLGLSNNGQRA